jgi:hypothetical protein
MMPLLPMLPKREEQVRGKLVEGQLVEGKLVEGDE